MKNFAFISDFDGTLTKKDFYQIVMDEYLKDQCEEMHKDWKAKKIKDVDYLGYVFKNIRRNEEGIYEAIMKISIDPFAREFIDKVKLAGGDFIIISAGTSYYIDKVLQEHGINGVEVYSNKGVFKDNGIHFVLDENSTYYSDMYGIDKYKIVKDLKEKYDTIFYAGDSVPDLKPSLIADTVFAKGKLVELLRNENKEFIEFENFSEIWDKLQSLL